MSVVGAASLRRKVELSSTSLALAGWRAMTACTSSTALKPVSTHTRLQVGVVGGFYVVSTMYRYIYIYCMWTDHIQNHLCDNTMTNK